MKESGRHIVNILIIRMARGAEGGGEGNFIWSPPEKIVISTRFFFSLSFASFILILHPLP